MSSPATVTVDTAGEELALSGVISGSAGLTKDGSGELDVNQANTYTGTTAVEAGTMLVDGDQPGSPVTIVTGSTLGGIGTVGAITAAGGTVNPGDGSGPGLLIDSGDLTLGADASSHNSAFAVQLDAGTTAGTDYTQLQVAGPINLSGMTSISRWVPDSLRRPARRIRSWTIRAQARLPAPSLGSLRGRSSPPRAPRSSSATLGERTSTRSS